MVLLILEPFCMFLAEDSCLGRVKFNLPQKNHHHTSWILPTWYEVQFDIHPIRGKPAKRNGGKVERGISMKIFFLQPRKFASLIASDRAHCRTVSRKDSPGPGYHCFPEPALGFFRLRGRHHF